MDYETLALYSVVISAVVFFAVLVYLFNRYLTPAVAAAQKTKNEEIALAEKRRDDAVRQADALRAEQSKLEKSLEDSLVRAEAEARRERERIVAEARAEGERLVHNADGELDRARLAGRDALQARLIELALERARVRAKSEVSAEVDRSLTERFFDRVAQEDRMLAEVTGG